MVHEELCFCSKIESFFKFHLISLFFFIHATDMIKENNKMKYNLFYFCLDDVDTKNKKINNANTKELKGTLKKNENNRRI